jgi:glycosyltransferase involved in cell wall biosynthesis
VSHDLTDDAAIREADAPRPMTVSIVLPAYNEAAALPTVVDDIRRHTSGAEVIVVDDGSTDGTARVAADLGCVVVAHERNRGKGTALRSGMARAKGEAIIVMDADATYPASAIPEMVRLLWDHDCVRADRQITDQNTPLVNRMGNRMLGATLRTLHGLGPGDHLSGLYGFRAGTLEELATEATGFDIEVEIGIKAKERGLSTAVIPIDYHPRIGDKKLHPARDGVAILARILRLVLIYRPMLLFGLPGLLLATASFIAALALVRGPIVTDFLGLSIHTFIVFALGFLAGFQLMTFGVAGAVYRQSLGFRSSPVLDRITSPAARSLAAVLGALLTLVCGIWLLTTIVGWVLAGGPEFTATRSLVLTATGAVFGLQLLSASLFVSLLADRTR